jgi:hypothetical protein
LIRDFIARGVWKEWTDNTGLSIAFSVINRHNRVSRSIRHHVKRAKQNSRCSAMESSASFPGVGVDQDSCFTGFSGILIAHVTI